MNVEMLTTAKGVSSLSLSGIHGPYECIIEQFCQEKKLKGPECGVVMSVMRGVGWK